MKTTEVPQDDANMLQGKFREPVYSLDENGNYTTVPSVGWEPKNEVMKEAWDQVHAKTESARRPVLSGLKSPLAFDIEKEILDIGLLAKYTGMWRWRVKRHLNPKTFSHLSHQTLEKYARVFNLTVEELIDINRLKSE